MIFVLISAAAEVLSLFLPTRLTPFGPVDDPVTGWGVLISLAITLLIANGLRRGYRWAWWVEVILESITVALGRCRRGWRSACRGDRHHRRHRLRLTAAVHRIGAAVSVLRDHDDHVPDGVPRPAAQQAAAGGEQVGSGDGQELILRQLGRRHDLLDGRPGRRTGT